MRSLLTLIAITGIVLIMASALSAAPVRVDYNGVLNPGAPHYGAMNPGQVIVGIAPDGWNAYGIEAGTAVGDLGVGYNTGSSSNSFAFRAENDGVIGVQGGYSVVFGGTKGTTTGQYGISQSYNATAGNIYTFLGGSKYSGNSVAKFNWGINNGSAVGAGNVTTANYSSTLNGKRQFMASVISDGSPITYFAGHSVEVSAGPVGINTWVDGFRVWEFDTAPLAAIMNSDFEGDTINLTEYNYDSSDGSRDWILPNGWIPFGNSFGKNEGIFVGNAAAPHSGANALFMDQYTGEGRKFVLQRLNYGGAGTYDISGWVYGWDTMSGNPLIGVDFSGGLDPTAASVMWTSGITAASVWQQRTISGFSATGDITIFLGAGAVGYNSAGGGAAFDDITVAFTPVPEPSSMLALATGLFGMAGFAFRRRK